MHDRILVALSGGVDSSVTAALLVRAGFDVTGVYMKQWGEEADTHGVCTWKTDRRDALRVAAHLGIPLYTWDFETEYREKVLSYMLREYNAFRTPNPDVMCNSMIKFGSWLERAKREGFTHLATGHYAKKMMVGGKAVLGEAVDIVKDQTYFLHQLSQEQLQSALFPLGTYTKTQVRQLAKRFGLPTAKRAESMGMCFVGEVPMREFLSARLAPIPGPIVDTSGVVLGEHRGLALYTIGERHVGVQSREGGATKTPLYVVDKIAETHTLVVGHEDDPRLHPTRMTLADVHLVSGQVLKEPLHCEGRFRHRGEKKPVTVTHDNGVYTLTLKKPERAVTPGQFAVLYKDGQCLGGGVVQYLS